ncbi:hypothetical protein EDD86DRAFT_9610 [Gorgonomyces haynaldii]|nr:hypothetical protein EDD86DRAFT_9610 [Gorgonomyces haynaldii]
MSQIKNGRILSSEESQSEHELKENDDTAYDSDGNQVPSLDRSLSKKEKQKLKMIVSRAKREQRVPLPVKKQPVKGMSQFLSQFGIERGQTHPPQFSQSVNQSLAQSSQSGNQPAEEVVAEGVTQLADMSVTQSVTQPVDDLVAQSLNASVDQTTTQSVNQLADMSVMQPADVPVTQTVDDTMAEAVDEPKLQTEEQLKTAEHKQTTVSQEMSHLKIKQLPTNLVPVKHMSSDSELEIEIVQINPRTPQEKKPKISKVEMNRQMLFLAEEQSRRRRQEEEEERKMQQEERKKKRAEKRMEFETFLEENRKKAMEPEPEPEPDILDIVDVSCLNQGRRARRTRESG